MDINAYLESGVLELYASQALSPAQTREVEALAEQFPEIKARIQLIQDALDQYSLAQATSPKSADLKERILAQARKTPPSSALSASSSRVASYPLVGWILALLGILLAGWYIYQYRNLKAENEVLKVSNSSLESNSIAFQERLEFLKNQETLPVTLTGSELAESSEILVFWNPSTNTTLLSIRDLPPPPAGKQYQLWSLLDNIPTNAGVLEYEIGSFQEMLQVNEATAFAITLEDAGGSQVPDLSQLYASGPVS